MKVNDNQSLLDLAIQYSGTPEACFDLALLNNQSITADLIVGEELIPSSINYGFVEFVKEWEVKKIIPATAVSDVFIEELEDLGIGQMIINVNFKAKASKV